MRPSATTLDPASCQRLMFPSWQKPKPRHPPASQNLASRNPLLLLLLIISLLLLFLLAWRVLRSTTTDAVLGKPLSPYHAALLGLPPPPPYTPPLSPHNPWRGASNRRRADLLSSIPGCGGARHPRLRRGHTASIFYAVRDANGTVDATRPGHPVHVVLGAHQAAAEVERRLEGVCAGETLAFRAGRLAYVVHVARAATGLGEDEVEDEVRRVERLARVLVGMGGRRGVSCDTVCRKVGMRCVVDGFQVVNSCPRLRKVFECRACERAAAGSAGPDMPCYVELSAPLGHPRGFCMVNPKPGTASCEAKYMHTRRLCPCAPKGEQSGT